MHPWNWDLSCLPAGCLSFLRFKLFLTHLFATSTYQLDPCIFACISVVEPIFAWKPTLFSFAPLCHLCSLCMRSLNKEPFKLLPLSSRITCWRAEFPKCAFLLIHTSLSAKYAKCETAVILPTHPISSPELMWWSGTHLPPGKSCAPSFWMTPYLCQEIPHKFLGTLIQFAQASPGSGTSQKGQDGCFLLITQQDFQAPAAEQVPPDKHLREMVPAQSHL